MTEEWRLLTINDYPGIKTQTIYHAVAVAMERYQDIPNTIIICWPADPVVCVGYHQIISEEVNLEYCHKNSIPIVRRCLGGGAVYLDEGQLFYQVIARLDSKKIPKRVADLYQLLLKAPIATYQGIGIPAEYEPVNDIVAEGKKISGNGAAMVGGARVLTGNLIFDFNFDEMINILKVPSEKFRDKIAKTLRERLGTIRNFLSDNLPSRNEVKKLLIENFEKTLEVTFTVNDALSAKEQAINEELITLYQSKDWLNLPLKRRTTLLQKRKVKISSSTQIYESVYKAAGGLIRLILEVADNQIKDIIISGDFSSEPMNAPELIENQLIDQPLSEERIIKTLERVYKEQQIEIPGISPADFSKSIMLSIEDLF
ncbi:MAG: hypothetical protein GF308_05035 [Candidatus Heimdallarchaeota archaeon]|nr:hypothetical protein [Candidatus Heimdallarchaeota archaeon]